MYGCTGVCMYGRYVRVGLSVPVALSVRMPICAFGRTYVAESSRSVSDSNTWGVVGLESCGE